jgi:hypothetical protein
MSVLAKSLAVVIASIASASAMAMTGAGAVNADPGQTWTPPQWVLGGFGIPNWVEHHVLQSGR